MLVGTGLYLTIALRRLQFRRLGYSLWLAFIKRRESSDEPGDISHFQALMTALSATVGTGNIAGVATAIAIGGPGALFWMWITGLVGMATKYSEALLAVKYLAYSTILGWSYYGERAIEYLLGERAIRPYRIVFSLMVGVGAILKLELVWALADVFNGLMALPNLIALLMLSPVVVAVSREYFAKLTAEGENSVLD